MPSYRASREAEIAATPEACFAAMTDYGSMPAWQRAVKRAEIVETDGDADVVEYELDAKLTTITYALRQTYREPTEIDSTYVRGPFRSMSGRWTFEPAGDGRTRARVEIEADPGRFLPGPVKRVLEDALLKRAVDDLRKHLEG
jgi:ribosome-associated toxin RatA of RatAB toxin-antitoxin module